MQVVAKVDRAFAAKFDNDLSFEWTLVDPMNNIHRVVYNKSLTDPTITDGWFGLRIFYELKGYHWCLLRYIGDSSFDLVIYRDVTDQITYRMPLHSPHCVCKPDCSSTNYISVQSDV